MIAEAAGEGQTGEGHSFEPSGSFNPTWCDLCGDLVWGLYDTGASRCVHCNYTCHVRCQRRVRLNCSILHSSDEKVGQEEEGEEEEEDGDDDDDSSDDHNKSVEASTLHNISTLRSEEVFVTANEGDDDDTVEKDEPELDDGDDGDDDDEYMTLKDVDHIRMDHDDDDHNREVGAKTLSASPDDAFSRLSLTSPELFGDRLDKVLEEYNEQSPSGQETVLDPNRGICRGFIRVEMNLSRPINVVSGSSGPPPVFNIAGGGGGGADSLADPDRTLTTFYLPPSTVKALHVTTETTTRDVVQSLLGKFRVADNPHKYAVYEKSLRGSRDPEGAGAGGGGGGDVGAGNSEGTSTRKATLSRARMRKVGNSERPLVLALLWCRDGRSSGTGHSREDTFLPLPP